MTGPAPAQRLAGKVAVVTGIGAGIGQGCALLFARHGATVYGCDIDAGKAAATVASAGRDGVAIHDLSPADMTDPAIVTRVIDQAASAHGGIDCLVNAAAIGIFAWIEDMSYADWRRTLTGEADIVFLACKAAWPHLKARGGSIINFASANGWMALDGSPALAHCAGKGAVLAMTRQLAMEGGPYGIRANTISPALVLTDATRPVMADPAFHARVMTKMMLGRVGEPGDIAWAALFLASDEASWVTGADFPIDGGATAW